MFPEIFEKLEIDRTPSGGLHFYYKLDVGKGNDFPRSFNIASRYSTEEELLERKDLKTRCFLEFKAEGGLSQCFPSKGYTKIKRSGFALISNDEHQQIMSLCYLYNQVIKEVPIKRKESRDNIYNDGETPFDCFNKSDEASNVLIELGWNFFKSNGIYDHYIKPGNKKKNVGASFNKETKNYKVFTSNSELDQRNYNPSSLLCFEKFNNDWSLLASYLVAKGYGKLKSHIEKSEVKKTDPK